MNKEDFITIINDHKKIVYKTCYSFCRQEEDRKDLEQEILIQLWHSLKQFDGRVKLSTWIYRVSHNTAISFYRKDKKRRLNKLKLSDYAFYLESEQNETEVLNEKIARLYKAINQLNDLEKSLILLYLDKLSHSEISNIMGISESNVGTKISRIKLKLKTLLN
tara:strand:- start:38 stop:526 length:489 start_codon:yes stop_codon:yes gene_type:complete